MVQGCSCEDIFELVTSGDHWSIARDSRCELVHCGFVHLTAEMKVIILDVPMQGSTGVLVKREFGVRGARLEMKSG